MKKNIAAALLLSLASLASANSATRADVQGILKAAGFKEASCRAVAGGMGEVCAPLTGSAKSAQDKLHAAATKLGWKLKGKWEQDSLRSATYVKGGKFINLYVNDMRPLANLAYITSNFDDQR